jgi:hypothetical protein
VARQLWVYANNVYLLGRNINIIKRNEEALLNVSNEVNIEVNAHKLNVC